MMNNPVFISDLPRRSSVREYAIVPLKEEGGHGMTMIPLRPTSHTGNEPFKVRYAEFAPKGNAIVYVDYDNNIYYKPGVMEQGRRNRDSGCCICSETCMGCVDLDVGCSTVCPILSGLMRSWQKQLGSQATWWNIKIQVNTTQVSEPMKHPVRPRMQTAILIYK